jgi:hypothetical protein
MQHRHFRIQLDQSALSVVKSGFPRYRVPFHADLGSNGTR